STPAYSDPIQDFCSHPLSFFPSRAPPVATLFPYTTLFRSGGVRRQERQRAAAGQDASAPVGHRARPSPAATAPPATPYRRRRSRSEEHTLNSSHDQISYAVFCLKKKMRERAPAYVPRGVAR